MDMDMGEALNPDPNPDHDARSGLHQQADEIARLLSDARSYVASDDDLGDAKDDHCSTPPPRRHEQPDEARGHVSTRLASRLSPLAARLSPLIRLFTTQAPVATTQEEVGVPQSFAATMRAVLARRGRQSVVFGHDRSGSSARSSGSSGSSGSGSRSWGDASGSPSPQRRHEKRGGSPLPSAAKRPRPPTGTEALLGGQPDKETTSPWLHRSPLPSPGPQLPATGACVAGCLRAAAELEEGEILEDEGGVLEEASAAVVEHESADTIELTTSSAERKIRRKRKRKEAAASEARLSFADVLGVEAEGEAASPRASIGALTTERFEAEAEASRKRSSAQVQAVEEARLVAEVKAKASREMERQARAAAAVQATAPTSAAPIAAPTASPLIEAPKTAPASGLAHCFGGSAAQGKSPPAEQEMRYDYDGLLYTRGDFIAEYGGTAEWEQAANGRRVATHVHHRPAAPATPAKSSPSADGAEYNQLMAEAAAYDTSGISLSATRRYSEAMKSFQAAAWRHPKGSARWATSTAQSYAVLHLAPLTPRELRLRGSEDLSGGGRPVMRVLYH